MSNRYVVIMAGGRGERFWPQSRLRRPKHLLPIVGSEPMLRQTVDRLGETVPRDHIFVVTNAEQADAIREICPDIPPQQVVGEPMGRDTAAAVGLATLLVQQADPEAVFAMLPADAVIHDSEGFQGILESAFQAAQSTDAIVTIGIAPEHPATGYGYIHRGNLTAEYGGQPAFQVQRFVEKPDLPTAQKYLDDGDYFWNAGMFFWRVPVIAEALQTHTPQLWQALNGIRQGLEAQAPLDELLAEHYPKLEKISIDYAVMEKARHVLMVPSAFDWDDVGEWPAVARHYPSDTDGNVVRGNAVLQDAGHNIIITEPNHTVAAIGIEGLIVVQTADATLICPKDKAQEIKQLVKQIGIDPKYQHLLE